MGLGLGLAGEAAGRTVAVQVACLAQGAWHVECVAWHELGMCVAVRRCAACAQHGVWPLTHTSMTGLWRAAATDMADASARSRLPSPFFASTITYFLRLLLRSSSAAKTPSVVPPECSPACLLAPAPSPPPPPPPSSSLPPPPATPPLLDSSTVSDSSDCIIRDPMIISSSRSSKRRRGTLSLTEAVRSEWKGVVLFVRSTVASSSKGIPGCASPAARSLPRW